MEEKTACTTTLVSLLKRSGAISSEHIRIAFENISRADFIQEIYEPLLDDERRVLEWQRIDGASSEYWARVCSDSAVVVKMAQGVPLSTSSRPSLMAFMLEALSLSESLTVLEIGTGTGYNAALIAHIVGPSKVASIEIDPELADRARERLSRSPHWVTVLCQDAGAGLPDHGAYDRIICTVGVADIPRFWADHLMGGGILLAPLKHGNGYPIARLERLTDKLAGRFVGWSGFVPACGALEVVPDATDAVLVNNWERLVGEGEIVQQTFAAPKLDQLRLYEDLGFFLSLESREAHVYSLPRGVGLRRPGDGWAIIDSTGTLYSQGRREIAAEVVGHLEDWLALDSPGISDYAVELFQEASSKAGPAGYFAQRLSGPETNRTWRVWRPSVMEQVQLAR